MTEQLKEIKVAVIDMNNGFPNQGLRGILNIVSTYKEDHALNLSIQVFDLRVKDEIPGTEFDIYISSGGPGSPYEGEGQEWESSFFKLLDDLEAYNQSHEDKKYAFLICHSFQMACRKYNLGLVTERKSNAFGIFPVTLTEQGENDIIYAGLTNPFYAIDSRDWQVVDAEDETFNKTGAEVLALEKERPHVDLERCVMSIRFSKEFVGTQFHPEADPEGMRLYLLEEEKKNTIIAAHGEEKYLDMLESLDNPDRILLTQKTILPNFLTEAIQSLKEA
ncbi:type 1 glutamine amidotransferase [Pedobacter cryoconitis]|uniref:GMP synthase-like glutamine amidotransferase n=1 Tax=Pedobacter cryoconitis TaxID=188932 RepID=A0A327SF92_9SPHI|nr:GMP synthase [Pedobacter cryoconitis]RAJ27082.1 GMP synthase-like glutamine amidotransferase [Pedobacter cryoconitis]